MITKFASKFASDILPSVVATIIGAYIVNHYIITKPGADAPVTASAATSDSKKPARKGEKPATLSSDVTNIPGSGVTAKGISEKAVFEKSPLEKAAEKPAADAPAETASLPVTSLPLQAFLLQANRGNAASRADLAACRARQDRDPEPFR